MEEKNCPKKCCNNNNSWGGKREQAGRKKTCLNKVSFNRRINENILNILKNYANLHGITVTEALESAILLQNNIYTLKGDGIVKIVIPTKNEKLCSHFGNCESFTFVEVDQKANNIISIESRIPEEGISCQSASWISEQGANIVLVGGMGMRPTNIFNQNGVKVVAGCPELPIRELVEKYLANELSLGENSCSGGHHDCHGHHHGEGHNCHH